MPNSKRPYLLLVPPSSRQSRTSLRPTRYVSGVSNAHPKLFARHAPRAHVRPLASSGAARDLGAAAVAPPLWHQEGALAVPPPSPVTHGVFFPSRRNAVEGLDRGGYARNGK